MIGEVDSKTQGRYEDEEDELNGVNNEVSPFKYLVYFNGNSSLHYDVKVRVNEVLNSFGELKNVFQV